MFCNSDSCDSAIWLLSEPRSRPLVIEAFYCLYSPSPCPYSPECVEYEFCELRHNGVLGSSAPHEAALSERMTRIGHQVGQDMPRRALLPELEQGRTSR